MNITSEYVGPFRDYRYGWRAVIRHSANHSQYRGHLSTKEEVDSAIEAYVRNLDICQECGEPFDAKDSTITSVNCFTCTFWLNRIEEHWKALPCTQRGGSFIIDGKAYFSNGLSTPKDKLDKRMRGFGGAYFLIYLGDGSFHETNDLWCQGDVPERFRSRLPNNATFVQGAKQYG